MQKRASYLKIISIRKHSISISIHLLSPKFKLFFHQKQVEDNNQGLQLFFLQIFSDK